MVLLLKLREHNACPLSFIYKSVSFNRFKLSVCVERCFDKGVLFGYTMCTQFTIVHINNDQQFLSLRRQFTTRTQPWAVSFVLQSFLSIQILSIQILSIDQLQITSPTCLHLLLSYCSTGLLQILVYQHKRFGSMRSHYQCSSWTETFSANM